MQALITLAFGLLLVRAASAAYNPCEAISPPGPNDTFIYGGRAVFRDLNWALRCYNAITIDYETAVQHVNALADYYRQYYSFLDIAKDPRATPQSNPLNLKVYSGGNVDIVGELQALVQSWPPNAPVPLAKLAFPVNDIFSSLRDCHVNPLGDAAAYGDIFHSHYLALTDIPRATRNVSENGVKVTVRADQRKNNKAVFSDFYSKKIISKIGGLTPMDWARAVIRRPTITDYCYKAEGTRVNGFIWNLVHGVFFPALTLGTFDHLTQPIHVQYKDGSNTTWMWTIFPPSSFGYNTSLAELSAQASATGLPYRTMSDARAIVAASQPLPTAPHAARTLSEQPGDARRSLQHGSPDQPPVSEHIYSTAGELIGAYGLLTLPDGSLVPFWKYTHFGNTPAEYAAYWGRFVNLTQQASAAGLDVSRLIFDVTTNGGGTASTFHLAVGTLFPELLSTESRYPWLPQYEMRLGPLAKLLVANKLLQTDQSKQGFFTRSSSLLWNATWVAGRAQELAGNRTALAGIAALHDALFAAINVLIRPGAASPATCGTKLQGIDEFCEGQWHDFYKGFTRGFNGQTLTDFFKSTPMETDILGSLIAGLLSISTLFAPYADQLVPSTNGTVAELVARVHNSSVLRDPSSLFLDTTQINRGGVTGDYTQRFSLGDVVAFASTDGLFSALDLPKQHPFKQILAVGDGRCGSACAQFSTAAWLYAKHNKSVSFKYFTFGGTGSSKDIDPRAFPGGTVQTRDPLSATWAFDGLTKLLAQWTGDEALLSQAATTKDHLPSFPSLNLLATPKYTASLGYNPSLGAAALPMDYYVIPPDFYAPAWFPDSGIGGSDLLPLYLLAAKKFA